jgi:hypothetical protein
LNRAYPEPPVRSIILSSFWNSLDFLVSIFCKEIFDELMYWLDLSEGDGSEPEDFEFWGGWIFELAQEVSHLRILNRRDRFASLRSPSDSHTQSINSSNMSLQQMFTQKSTAVRKDKKIIERTKTYGYKRWHAQKLIKHSILESPAIYERARLAPVRWGTGAESSSRFAKSRITTQ